MRKLIALAIAVSCFASTALADDELAAEGKPAPMFRLPVYNAKATGGASALGLDKYVGPDATDKDTKVVLLSFMASFCGPCKKEMPYLESLHEKYGPKGLRIMMVSIDTEEKGYAIINELIEKNKVQFPVLKDRFNLVARRWLGTQSPLPSVFMVTTDGVVKMVHRGYNQEASELLDKEVAAAVGAGK
jgi:thiol-disulfide isomerase/thioredoxin